MVGERLLHDPVDGGLELGVEPAADLHLYVDLEPLDGREPPAEALDRRGQPDLVQRRRAQLGDQRPQALDLGPDVFDRLAHRLLERHPVAPAQCRGEQHLQRPERLQRLVVQLARPAAALLLGRGDRVAQAVLGDRAGGSHGGRGARREGEEQPLLLVAECGVAGEAVEGREQAERHVAVDERHQQRGGGAADPEVAIGSENSLQPPGAAGEQHLAHRRVGERQAAAERSRGHLAGSGREVELVAVDQQQQDRAGIEQRAPALDDQLEHAVEVRLAADCAGDGGGRLEPPDGALGLRPAVCRVLVQAGVLHRQRGPVGRGSPPLSRPPRRTARRPSP